ncbi:MAG: hypothetical protein GF388_03660 [Candidatus Aegiribacteria sp.]|nr:hypothetical protein [Candidatus Aegiribacteria sp.]MBD3294360.1 hypothetical protein [Candidatus Fermentibacteria bacterium]
MYNGTGVSMEKVNTVLFPWDEVAPEIDRVIARSGCPPWKRDSLEKPAKSSVEELMKTAEPLALYRNLEVLETGDRIIRTREISFESRSLVRYLGSPSVITLFLATAGPTPEFRSEELSAGGRHLESYMLDSAASELVEKTARSLQMRIAEQLRGCTSTARFAPGFGDLALDCQEEILDLLKAGEYGIGLVEDSCMLVPAKTATGVIGWHRRKN